MVTAGAVLLLALATSFQPAQQIGPDASWNWATGLTAGNFSSDQVLDVLGYSSDEALLLPGNASPLGTFGGTSAVLTDIDWRTVVEVTAGHFYGTGYSDVVIRYTTGQLAIRRNLGQGHFDTAVTINPPAGSADWSDAAAVTAGNFDGGTAGQDNDLLIRWNSGAASVLSGNGDGTFGAPQQVRAPGDLLDLADIAQGAVYGPVQSTKTLYRWNDGTLYIDGNGSPDLVHPAPTPVTKADAQLFVRSGDDRGRVASFEYTLDGSTTPVKLDAQHNTLTIQLHGLTTGPHTLSVLSVDPVGNRSPATTYPFTTS